jgi:hypothetical protein
MNEILTTLYNQMRLGKLFVMVGASHQSYSNTENRINFKFKMNSKMNHCTIQYNYGHDDYTMIFSKVGSVNFKTVKTINGLYFDQLNKTFEEVTGLYTSL